MCQTQMQTLEAFPAHSTELAAEGLAQSLMCLSLFLSSLSWRNMVIGAGTDPYPQQVVWLFSLGQSLEPQGKVKKTVKWGTGVIA